MKGPDWNAWIKSEEKCKSWLDNYIKKNMIKKGGLTSSLYLKKASHNLDFANWLKEKHKKEIPDLFGEERFYDWAINAYYYVFYHSSLALLSLKGYSSKSHYATLCFIIYHYYHKTRHLKKEDIGLMHQSINKEDIEMIAKTKSLRERASYDVSALFEEKLVENAKNNAVYFFNKIKRIAEE